MAKPGLKDPAGHTDVDEMVMLRAHDVVGVGMFGRQGS
jgi:hypothetical protein